MEKKDKFVRQRMITNDAMTFFFFLTVSAGPATANNLAGFDPVAARFL
jgi:hypothetical protein